MQTDNYRTGSVDVVSNNLPKNAKGAIYRVLTFAESYEIFLQKVGKILENAGDKLILVEETENLTEFLKHSWLIKDHEIYEMPPTAEKNKNDLISGQIEFYTHDDA